MAADRRPGNLAHLERLLNAWSRDNTEVLIGDVLVAMRTGESVVYDED